MSKIFKRVCQIKNISAYQMARDLGLANNHAYKLCESESLPRSPMLVYKLFRYSGLTAREFLELLNHD